MTEFRFDLHGLVRGRVRGIEWLVGPVRRELGYFETDPTVLDLDLELVGPGKMAGQPQWAGNHLGSRWRARGESETPLTLRIEANRLSRFIVSKWIVEPAVRVVAQRKGVVMAHAAAISDGQKGALVGGAGGAGKTTWVLAWLAGDKPYLSDDFSVIYDKMLKCYPTLLRLSGKNLMVNSAINGLNPFNKAEIWIRTLARRLSFGKLKLYYKARPQDAIQGLRMSPGVPLAGAIWLADPATESGPLPRKLTPDEMADRMAAVDEAEAHGFGAAWLPPSFWPDHRRMLAEALAGLPCVLVAGRSLPPAAASIDELLTNLGWR